MPARYPTSVAFGGAGLDELYVTSALVMFPQAERPAHPQDGSLFRLFGMGKGLPEPFFGG
jgi:L-arabinonolactonase